MLQIKDILKNLLIDLVKDIYEKNYDCLVKTKRNGRLSTEEIEEAISGYPGQLSLPPSHAFEHFDIYEVTTKEHLHEWDIEFLLWFNGKESQLTLNCTVIEDIPGALNISISSIHVM